MSFRITTNGMYRNYESELMHNKKNLNEAITRVQTGREINSYADDPAAASQAFQLRRSYWRAGDQLDNITYVKNKFSSAWDVMDSIVDGNSETPGLNAMRDSLMGLTDTAGASRRVLGMEMQASAESLVNSMNINFSGAFIFGGADGMNPPFALDDSTSPAALTYRGVPVDTDMTGLDAYNAFKAAGNEFPLSPPVAPNESDYAHGEDGELTEEGRAAFDAATEAYEAASAEYEALPEKFNDYLKENYPKEDGSGESRYSYEGVVNALKLDAMNREATYVDIGIGFTTDANGDLVTTSAFNSALSGIAVLGYGVDEDGDPQNLVSLMMQIGEIYKNCDEHTGDYAGGAEDAATADRLVQKLYSAIGRVHEEHTALDTRAGFLEKTRSSLTTKKDELNERIVEFEEVDPARAILDMNWANYCYNAALKVGNSLLSQSLMDYLQ